MWSPTSGSNPASPTSAAPPITATFSNNKQKYAGKRVAQIVKLKPEFVEEYKKCHAAVWPEVLKQIKNSNIEDCELPYLMRIFSSGS
jgi:hypothetical protein